jgi:DNA-binding transcriptional regulator YdaS (Cro superfamily)
MNKVRSMTELIEALGGQSTLARNLGIGQSAVANWVLRGEIPAAWHLRLLADCRARGIEVDTKAIFGVDLKAA